MSKNQESRYPSALAPSKIAAILVTAATAAFGGIPVWVVLMTGPDDGLWPYVIGPAIATVFISIAVHNIESFSGRLSKEGASNIQMSITRGGLFSRRHVLWRDVKSAVTDGRYVWLGSANNAVKIDSGPFWNPDGVITYIQDALRPFDIDLIHISDRY